jgi:hypothetical protein
VGIHCHFHLFYSQHRNGKRDGVGKIEGNGKRCVGIHRHSYFFHSQHRNGKSDVGIHCCDHFFHSQLRNGKRDGVGKRKENGKRCVGMRFEEREVEEMIGK